MAKKSRQRKVNTNPEDRAIFTKSYEAKVKDVPFLQEKLWSLAEKKCKKDKGRKNFDYTLEVYKEMVVSRRKSRRVFDKKLLCYKVNSGDPEAPVWDFTITPEMIEKNKPKVDAIFRTVKHILNKEDPCKTFADVLKFRPDWLVPDSNGLWGTDESISLSLEVCRSNLDSLDEELEALGFEKLNFVSKLVEENRTGAETKELIDKLEGLGLKKKEDTQLNLF